jgi:hypothetical protein
VFAAQIEKCVSRFACRAVPEAYHFWSFPAG